MAETPRTDAFAEQPMTIGDITPPFPVLAGWESLAKQLETELSQATDRIAELERQLAARQALDNEIDSHISSRKLLRERAETAERQLAAAQREARAFYALSEERMGIIEATRSQLATARQDERERCAQAVIGTSIDDYGTLSHCAAVIRALEGQT